MKWYKNLYTGESVAHRKNRIKWKIIHNAGQIGLYVIALPSNEKNLLDLIPAWELMQKHYPKKQLYIIGLAGDYDEAVTLAAMIVCEAYAKTGSFCVADYLGENKTKKKEETQCTSSF